MKTFSTEEKFFSSFFLYFSSSIIYNKDTINCLQITVEIILLIW